MANIPALPAPGAKPWNLNPHITAMNSELNGRLSETRLLELSADAKSPNTLFARDYCFEDGMSDESQNITQAVSDLVSIGGGSLIFTPGKRYFVNSDVSVTAPSNVKIRFVGTGAKFLAGPSAVNVLSFKGNRTQLTGGDAAYTATNPGDTSITSASNLTGVISPGDWIMLWSSDADNAERPTQYMSGEAAIVQTVNQNVITLDRPIQLLHTSGAQRRLYKLNLLFEPELIDLDIAANPDGGRPTGLLIEYAIRPLVLKPAVSGKRGRYGVYLNQVVGGSLLSPSVDTWYDSGNGTAPNGIGVFLNGCIGTVVDQPTARRARHCVDVNSFSSVTNPGLVSTGVVVNNLEGINTFAPAASVHHARGTIFNHLVAINCGGGVHTRGYRTTIRDFRPVGGYTGKPDEWDASRAVAAGIAVGETDTLPAGEGFAGTDLTIENYDPRGLPADWRSISWSDRPGPGTRISGPAYPLAPDVVLSDSANRANGAPGEPDMALGGVPDYTYWAWKQGTAGVVIAGGKFARPSGDIGHGMRTSAPAPRDLEVSATWDAIGTPSNMSCLMLRASDDNTLTSGYALGVSANGTLTIVKRLANSSTNLIASAAGAVVNGDRVAFRAIGRSLTGLVNGKVVIEASDSDVLTSGRVGFYFRSAGGDGWQADDFLVKKAI